jgi:hypothetical protein
MRKGEWGWLGLLAYVVLWDVLAPETLSRAARRHRRTTAGIGAILMVHLLG